MVCSYGFAFGGATKMIDVFKEAIKQVFEQSWFKILQTDVLARFDKYEKETAVKIEQLKDEKNTNIEETEEFEHNLREMLKFYGFTAKQCDACVYAVLNVANEE